MRIYHLSGCRSVGRPGVRWNDLARSDLYSVPQHTVQYNMYCACPDCCPTRLAMLAVVQSLFATERHKG